MCLGQTLKYVGLSSPDRVYKKPAGLKIFLKFIREKEIFSYKYIINKD